MQFTEGFVNAVLASPLGVSWLAFLETHSFDDNRWKRLPSAGGSYLVATAVDRVGDISFGALMNGAVVASVFESGPWMQTAPEKIADAYRHAERRTPILEVIVERFGDRLHATLDLDRQQWFTDGHPSHASTASAFYSLGEVYSAGEIPAGRLFTATDPPTETLLEMVGAWEYETGPITRWKLPVQPTARIFEIHRPADWAELVVTHPRFAEPHPGWELPGFNHKLSQIAPLLETPGQRAARGSVRHHLVPDWRSVSNEAREHARPTYQPGWQPTASACATHRRRHQRRCSSSRAQPDVSATLTI